MLQTFFQLQEGTIYFPKSSAQVYLHSNNEHLSCSITLFASQTVKWQPCKYQIICNSYRQFHNYLFNTHIFFFLSYNKFCSSFRYTQLGLQTALISSIQACQHNYTCTFTFVQLMFMYIQIFVQSSLIKILTCISYPPLPLHIWC